MEKILNISVPQNSIGIWWIGQGGFVFKTAKNKIVIVDPYLSNSVEKHGGPKRMVDIPIRPKDIVSDLLLCTHDHLDHTDPDTLIKVRKVKKFIGPSSVCHHYKKLDIPEEKIVEINRGEEKRIEDIKVFATFAKHTEDSVGYIFDFNGLILYISGDTEYDKRLKKVRKFRPDIMIICINGKAGNMSYKDATILTKEISPRLVIPMHYGMFKENTVDPNLFIEELKKEKVDVEGKIIDFNKVFLYGG